MSSTAIFDVLPRDKCTHVRHAHVLPLLIHQRWRSMMRSANHIVGLVLLRKSFNLSQSHYYKSGGFQSFTFCFSIGTVGSGLQQQVQSWTCPVCLYVWCPHWSDDIWYDGRHIRAQKNVSGRTDFDVYVWHAECFNPNLHAVYNCQVSVNLYS